MEQGILRGDFLEVPPRTIPQLFQDLLKENGSHFLHCPAIISQGITMTYSDVNVVSDGWCRHLKGVLRKQQRHHRERRISKDLANAAKDKPNEFKRQMSETSSTNSCIGQPVVGIFIPANANRILAMMTVFKLGSCYVPLDSTLPDQRIAAILEETKCQVVHPV